MKNAQILCSVCEAHDPEILVVSDMRRTRCQRCGHSQRVDIEKFDYSNFAMGGTGVARERLKSQASFILAHLRENVCALEVGCAGGDLANELRLHRKFLGYDGIEISPAGKKAAKNLDRLFKKPLNELLDSSEIREATYDIVLSSHVLEHLEEPFEMLQSMKRVLKRNGLLFIETPNQSGHSRLLFDDNRAHLHFFCSASLTRILSRVGFEIIALETGSRLDARYSDCLRVIAQWRETPPEPNALVLSNAVQIDEKDKVVFWGAGRMVDEILAHYFDAKKISFFVDRDASKHGCLRMGVPVYSSEALKQGSGWCIIINSLEMEKNIREEIAAEFADRVTQVISIAELLDKTAKI